MIDIAQNFAHFKSESDRSTADCPPSFDELARGQIAE